MVPPPSFDARLVRATLLTPSVRELVFERVDQQPMGFEPGQWLNAVLPIAVEGAAQLKRSYSIASAPDGTPRFEMAVTRVRAGPASMWLHCIAEGQEVTFVGPQGFFTRPPANASPSLMIATGTGITPLRSMIHAAIGAGSRAPMWLLLGVRHEEDVLYGDELRGLAQRHSFVRFEPSLSQPLSNWKRRRGYVQAHVRELWEELTATGGGRPHAYVCGLERMVGSVRTMLRKELLVPREQVHSERYD